MTIVRRWTGCETKLLREALRLSVRDFAAHLGVGMRTVNKWEARLAGITLRPHMQEVLDAALTRASDEVRARFAAVVQADVPTVEDVVGVLLVTQAEELHLDLERLEYYSKRVVRLDSVTVDDLARLNRYLWRVFATARHKRIALPFVRRQLDLLADALRRPQGERAHKRLCALAGDLFQLAGEIFFDSNQYTYATHCYTLAITASKEANGFDLWAFALTRHAFIGV